MKTWDKGAAKDALSSEVLAFLSGNDIQCDERLVAWDALTLMAHNIMLHKIGMLTDHEVAEILKELLQIYKDGLALKPELEDVHGNIEAVLIEKLGDVGKKARTGLSRNDQVLADLRLYMKHEIITVVEKTLVLCEVIGGLAKKYEHAVMPGYTHHQQAMPYTFGSHVMSYVYALLDSSDALIAAYHIIDKNPLGAGAGYNVPLPLDKKMTTQLLGFSDAAYNALYHIASRGKHELLVVQALSQLMIDLNRIAADCVMFSMKEFGFISLPDGYITGSSIMPQKKNPDVCEVVKGKTARVLGNATQIMLATKNLPSGYHRDLQETKGALMESFGITQECLDVLAGMMEKMTVHEGAMKAAFGANIFATHEALSLAQQDVPYKEAYARIGEKLKKGEHIASHAVAADMGDVDVVAEKKKAVATLKTAFSGNIEALMSRAKNLCK